MQPNSRYLRTLLCLLVSIGCAWSQIIPIRAQAERNTTDQQADILVSTSGVCVTAVLVKDAADFYRLGRRELVAEQWPLLDSLTAIAEATAFGPQRPADVAFPLCEFARRELSGVLLS